MTSGVGPHPHMNEFGSLRRHDPSVPGVCGVRRVEPTGVLLLTVDGLLVLVTDLV